MKKITLFILLASVQSVFAQLKPVLKNAQSGIFILCGREIPASLHYKIERKADGESEFTFIAETFMPGQLPAFTGLLMQWNATCPFYKQPTQANAAKAFALFQSHNFIDSVYYYNSIPLYLYASGCAFLDVGVQEGKTYTYKISYGGQSTITDAFTFRKEVLGVTAKLKSKEVLGSNVQLKWYVQQVDKNNPPHVVKAFRNDNLQTPFREINALCGFQSKHDSLFVILYDTVIDQKFYYSYCIRMYDRFENPSSFSDTASLLNIYENTVPVIYLHTLSNPAKQAIELTWKFKTTPGVRSIDVYKSTSYDSGFQLVHSAKSADTLFNDVNVEPITSYYYYVQVNGLYEKGAHSAKVSGMLKSAIPPAAPQHLHARQADHGIELNWQRLDPATRGYYVYRGFNYHPEEMLQVSGLLVTDSLNVTFIDTTDLVYGKVYSYCVKAVSIDYTIGNTRDTIGLAFMKMKKGFDFSAPSSVWVKQINNTAKIVWDRDTLSNTVTGYELLRRNFKNTAEKVSATWNVIADVSVLQNHSSFLDTSVVPMMKYEYAVKAHYATQVTEPSVATAFELQYEKPITPVALQAFYTGNTMVISWEKTDIHHIASFKLFRESEIGNDVLVGTATANQSSIVDKNVERGKEYSYYLISVDGNGISGNKSGVVSVQAQ